MASVGADPAVLGSDPIWLTTIPRTERPLPGLSGARVDWVTATLKATSNAPSGLGDSHVERHVERTEWPG